MSGSFDFVLNITSTGRAQVFLHDSLTGPTKSEAISLPETSNLDLVPIWASLATAT